MLESDDEVTDLVRFAGDADLRTGIDRSGLTGRIRGHTGNELVGAVGCTTLMVKTHEDSHTGGLLRRILMEYVFD